MAESLQHINLVKNIYNYAINVIPMDYSKLIMIDSPESCLKPSRTSEGFVPDLYYCHNELLLIGEAKTSDDFDRPHSISQYMSYLKECACFEGNSLMVIAVPWTEYITAKNLIRRIKKHNEFEVEIIVINNNGKMEII